MQPPKHWGGRTPQNWGVEQQGQSWGGPTGAMPPGSTRTSMYTAGTQQGCTLRAGQGEPGEWGASGHAWHGGCWVLVGPQGHCLSQALVLWEERREL